MNLKYNKIFVALPILDELDYLPYCLDSLTKQTFKNYEVFVCVNQPESWWTNSTQLQKCLNNQKTLEILKSYNKFNLKIIDKSSKGNGWDSKNFGIGWARKVLMDEISKAANDNDLIVSLDADTVFEENYFNSLIENFNKHQNAVALSTPYYHELSNNKSANRAILRYEIYTRNYLINLFRIKSPYSFTALGSALAIPLWAHNSVQGMTPKKSGEDFYFFQKLRKYGEILYWNEEKVFPAARFSDRVFFGTGPAMIKGSNGDWDSYPIYHYSLFDEIQKTYDLIPSLYSENIETPFIKFLNEQFNDENFLQPLRKNSKTLEQFIKAFHHKADGLRILQFLKNNQKKINLSDEECLKDFLIKFHETYFDLNFINSSIEELNNIRNILEKIELDYRKDN